MNNLINRFKKQGGWSLIKYYLHFHQMTYAILMAPFLLGNRVGQELFREAISNRIQKRFEKKWLHKEINQDNSETVGNIDESCIDKSIIWFTWFQGIENAPKLIQLNYTLLNKFSGDSEVILLTKDNLFDYVKLPSSIVSKWDNGVIPNTQFSDIIRIELLKTYGGIWIDATVTLTQNIPSYFYDNLFLYQALKPGKNGLAIPISSWVIAAQRDNIIIKRTRELLLQYWSNSGNNIEYFVLHRMLLIAMKENPAVASQICPIDNSQPHALLISAKENNNSENFNIGKIIPNSPVHKLSYKVENKSQKENIDKIINELCNFERGN